MAEDGFRGDGAGVPDEILRCLEGCAAAARSSLATASPCRDEVIAKLRGFAAQVEAVPAPRPADFESEQIRLVLGNFGQTLSDTVGALNQLLQEAQRGLAESYTLLEENAPYVTIMLFGRTRAGKSTLMEALTYGDGKSMGRGRQHATREIRQHLWPAPTDARSAGPALRIVDTPGIEGFRGGDLAAKADRFVEQSDHVFFLLSDDKAGSDELERFRQIRTRGKSVTVILNVKTKETAYDILLERPDYIFRKDEIKGHCRRIERYLRDNLELPKPTVIPVHARAAWHAIPRAGSVAPSIDLQLLRERSRIAHLEHRILQFIREEALPARVRSARDLVRGYITGVQDRLPPLEGQYRQLISDVSKLRNNLERGLARAERRADLQLRNVLAGVDAAKQRVPLMIEELVAGKSGGKALRARWEALLEETNINNDLSAYAAETKADFRKEIREQVSVSAFDVKIGYDRAAEGLLDDYAKAARGKEKHRYARAGLRAGAAGLTFWAVTNFWNPTGWAAALALAGGAVATYAADKAVKTATDAWVRSTERQLRAKQDAIVRELQAKLERTKKDLGNDGAKWLERVVKDCRALIDGAIGTVERHSQHMLDALADLLCSLGQARGRIDRELVLDFLVQVVPEVRDGSIHVRNVTREPGMATQILVEGRSCSRAKAVSLCQAEDGSRLDRLRTLLGGESVVFVDGDAEMKQQVQQALQPLAVRSTDIRTKRGGGYIVRIRGKNAKSAAGVQLSLRLASQLLNRPLVLAN